MARGSTKVAPAKATAAAPAVIEQPTRTRVITNLIGFVSKRDAADFGGDESSIAYDGAVPIKDCLDHLFNWGVVEGRVQVVAKIDGGSVTITDPTRKGIVREDTKDVFGIFSERYKATDHADWFVGNVLPALSETVGIGAAGCPGNGAVAWASLEQMRNSSVEGVHFRPALFAVQSLDGSLPTMYHLLVHNMTTGTFMVPDVTGKSTRQIGRRRHTVNAEADALTQHQAAELIKTAWSEFRATVRTLTETPVSNAQWLKFLDAYIPLPEYIGRGMTMAQNKRVALDELWKHDDRVSPWKGTAYGVLAAVSTFAHYEGYVRKVERSERNMLRAASGRVFDLDSEAIKVLNSVM